MEGNGREESSAGFAKYLNRQSDWLEKTKGNLMVTATVIAAGLSFQIMVNPPGGVWQDNVCAQQNQTSTPGCKGIVGTAVLEHLGSKRIAYLAMVISSVMSFSASMSLILLVISGLKLRNRMVMVILAILMLAAVLCTSVAFYCAVLLVQFEDDTTLYILRIYIKFWICFPVVIFLIHLVRWICKLIRCICSCCRRLRSTRRMLPRAASPTH